MILLFLGIVLLCASPIIIGELRGWYVVRAKAKSLVSILELTDDSLDIYFFIKNNAQYLNKKELQILNNRYYILESKNQ